MRSGDLYIEYITSRGGGLNGTKLTHLPTGEQASCDRVEDRKHNATIALRELVKRVRVKE